MVGKYYKDICMQANSNHLPKIGKSRIYYSCKKSYVYIICVNHMFSAMRKVENQASFSLTLHSFHVQHLEQT